MAVELASAYVTLVPSARGMQAAIASEMGGPAAAAGTQAGGVFGSKFAKAGALAGAAALGKGVFDFTSFERGINEVFTLIPDAGQATFDKLEGQTKDFAKEFGVLPNDVIPALYDSLSAGVPSDNVFAFLEGANKFAKAGATDLGTAVDGLTSTMNAYGLGAEDTERVSDSLFTAVKLGKTTVDELSNSMFQVAPIASSVGVPIEQISAAFATLTAQGTPTSVAATQMRGAIAELAKGGTKSSKAFQDAFGQTFQEFIDGGGTIQEAAAGMQAAAEETGVEMLDMFGSVEGGQAFIGLAADVDKSQAALDAVQDGAGATQEAFEQMESGIGPVFDKLKAQFAVALIDLGDSLAPAIELIGGFALVVIQAFTALPGPVRSGIVIFATAAATMLAFAGPAAKMVKAIGLVSKAFTLLAANPWVLLIIAAVALVFIIVKYWDEIKAALIAAWDAVKAAAETTWNAITTAITVAVEAVATAVVAAWDAVWLALTATWGAIQAAAQAVWDTIASIVQVAGDLVMSYINTFYVAPVQFLISVFESLPGIATAAWNGVKAAVEAVVDAIVAAIDRIKQAAQDALGPVGDVIGFGSKVGGGVFGAVAGVVGVGHSGGVVGGPKNTDQLILARASEQMFTEPQQAMLARNLAAFTPGTRSGGGYVHNDFRGLIVRDDADLKAIKRSVERVARGQGQERNGGLNW